MTTRLFATHPLAFGHELHLELGRTRAMILALLATLCVAVVAPTALRADRLWAATFTQPIADLPIGQADISAVVPARLSVTRDPGPEIDALATLVAKRYRIANETTRGLVAAAYREGRRVGLDPLLIVAVIAVESRFNPIAESDAGAQGLMQVIPGYHKEQMEAAGVDSALDPHDNIRLGAQILKEYIRRGGTEVAGLQIYNGATADASNAYAVKVLGERQRLQQAVQRLRDRPLSNKS
jgi:soluble lytic murein transglycosylase-like protein